MTFEDKVCGILDALEYPVLRDLASTVRSNRKYLIQADEVEIIEITILRKHAPDYITNSANLRITHSGETTF